MVLIVGLALYFLPRYPKNNLLRGLKCIWFLQTVAVNQKAPASYSAQPLIFSSFYQEKEEKQHLNTV